MCKVLIVEDAPAFRSWLVERFRQDWPDWTVLVAVNLHEALAQAARERPDLLILDLGLPRNEIDPSPHPRVGLSVLQAVKRLNPAPQVLVLTSYDTFAEDCRRLGANALVSKSAGEVWEAVRTDLRRLLSAAGNGPRPPQDLRAEARASAEGRVSGERR